MLKQILQGKHMKCGVEANISMHLALALICFKEWLTSNGKYKDVINEVMSTSKKTKQLERTKQHTYRAFLCQEIHQDKIVAIMIDGLPAPLALVELNVCNFTTLCNNNHCKCYKNNLPCTDMCKCIGCQIEDESQNYEFEKNKEYDSAEENFQ